MPLKSLADAEIWVGARVEALVWIDARDKESMPTSISSQTPDSSGIAGSAMPYRIGGLEPAAVSAIVKHVQEVNPRP
jgi:hypothetical protein